MCGHGDPWGDNTSRYPAITATDFIIREAWIFQIDVVVVLTFEQVAFGFPGFADHHGTGDPNVEITTNEFIILRRKEFELKGDEGFAWNNFPDLCVGPLVSLMRNRVPASVRLIKNTDRRAKDKEATG